MNKDAFKQWLCDVYLKNNGKPLARRAQENRVANSSTVEQAEGDLDEHFQQDKMRRLLERLSYSAKDAREKRPALHSIPINGDIVTGTSTYRHAINLYREFRISQQAIVPVAEDRDEAWKDIIADPELAAMEGATKMAFVRHRKREQFLRDAKVVEARKLGKGKLKCEVPGCGFDFEMVYGEIGRDYAQVHHLKPLGDRTAPSQTKLADLAVVCANCHAMIHRGGKCRSLDGLIKP